MCKSTHLARATLLAYLLLVLQPCVMAMGHEAHDHHENCHQDSLHLDSETCLSQSASACAADDSIFDDRDSWNGYSNTLPATSLPGASLKFDAASVAASRYFTRAPPRAGPALNIRHCVFLK